MLTPFTDEMKWRMNFNEFIEEKPENLVLKLSLTFGADNAVSRDLNSQRIAVLSAV